MEQVVQAVDLAIELARHQGCDVGQRARFVRLEEARLEVVVLVGGARFPQDGMEEKLVARVNTLRANYETVTKNLARARGYLRTLPGRVTDPAAGKPLEEAAAAIAAELNPDTIDRLEAFIGLAQQAEQQQQQKRTPEHTPEQLLALAVSGWLLGNSSAEAKVETALRLWRSRQFVLAYQKTHSSSSRKKMLDEYNSKQGVPFDELAQERLRLGLLLEAGA